MVKKQNCRPTSRNLSIRYIFLIISTTDAHHLHDEANDKYRPQLQVHFEIKKKMLLLKKTGGKKIEVAGLVRNLVRNFNVRDTSVNISTHNTIHLHDEANKKYRLE